MPSFTRGSINYPDLNSFIAATDPPRDFTEVVLDTYFGQETSLSDPRIGSRVILVGTAGIITFELLVEVSGVPKQISLPFPAGMWPMVATRILTAGTTATGLFWGI